MLTNSYHKWREGCQLILNETNEGMPTNSHQNWRINVYQFSLKCMERCLPIYLSWWRDACQFSFTLVDGCASCLSMKKRDAHLFHIELMEIDVFVLSHMMEGWLPTLMKDWWRDAYQCYFFSLKMMERCLSILIETNGWMLTNSHYIYLFIHLSIYLFIYFS